MASPSRSERTTDADGGPSSGQHILFDGYFNMHEEDIIANAAGKLILAVLIASLGPRMAHAQENEPDRWKVSAEFSFTDQGGNKVLRLLTGGLNVTHLEAEQYELEGSVTSRYGKSEGEVVARNHNADLGIDLRPREHWSPFLFADAERDEFKRLDLRLSSGFGAKYSFDPDNDDQTSVSLALLYSYERVAPEDDDSGVATGPAMVEHRARWSLRGRTSQQIRDGITLRHTTFVQPLWNEMADYLLRSETGIKVLLTERLALSADFELRRDSRPPEGIGPNDRLFKTGIIFDF